MKIVIQCAASKDPRAGTMQTDDGTPVIFVAQPDKTPPNREQTYVRPDDACAGTTWRDRLLAYNARPDENPLNLLPAYRVYGELLFRPQWVVDIARGNVISIGNC
jgi:hypothetical protein